MKKVISFLLALTLMAPYITTSANAEAVFTDLDPTPWAEEEITYLSNLDIINGYGNGKFGPTNNITRAQVALMLVTDLHPERQTAVDPGFTDVTKSNFYYDAIAIAFEKGYLNGYPDGSFQPSATISRAEAAVMVDRAYEIKGEGDATHFSDVNVGYSWALDSILDLSSQNIINGYPSGTFQPGNSINRAEFSVVMARTIEPEFRPLGDTEAHFIDVGQGDSILLESPSGKTILVDGGRKSAGEKVVDYLNKAGIDTIDLMVATHPDADHIGGLIDVLQQVEVKEVLDSGKSHTTDTYMEYLKLIDQKNIPFSVAEEGSTINFDEALDIKVLHSTSSSSDNNESSIVLEVSHGEIDFLLTGDATVDNEQQIIDNYEVEAEILKVGHHGASTSTSEAFLAEVNPEVGILSYGENSYGHPESEIVDRLRDHETALYSTCHQGTITVTTNGSGYDVNAEPFQGEANCGTNSEPTPDPDPEPNYPINVNTADYETLQLIPGVGESIAQYIIDYRNAYGPFQTIEELDNVHYIGPATVEEMRPYITL
ncbi:S-layer homology domain-containing protein [Thalassobacillus pellis]|uniref:S-layer homology domain-containing protein n=1 Tax=Thalassobacillus pellis TaxID=748008 RepID=UPI001EF85475|nr:S-layer homology domain-containing protein [Thalassobacillus pellis]MBM7551683.1 competence ComEA-like helix-hairpin-helix protein [Thalassobacillus pellis]